MLLDNLPDDDLRSNEGALFSMLTDALSLYYEKFSVIRATISTVRGERNDVHDCMTSVSKTRFPYQIKGSLFLIVLGRYRIRLKKLNERLETSNYPTQAALDFGNQVTTTLFQTTLFPELMPINLNVGYVPDRIDLRNSTLWMTQPGPGGWVYQLRAGGASTGTSFTPPSITDPNAQAPKTRVRPKRTKQPKKGTDKGEPE